MALCSGSLDRNLLCTQHHCCNAFRSPPCYRSSCGHFSDLALNKKRCQLWPLNAATTYDAAYTTQTDSEVAQEDADTLLRRGSHLHASSSNGSRPEDVGDSALSGEATTALDALALEINACDEIDDIVEVVGDEADLISGPGLVNALKRIASICKRKGKGSKQDARQEVVKLAHSEDFRLLLTLILNKSHELSALDVADSLWSLATMNMRVLQVLRQLQREVELLVHDMDERALATTAWSFASLRHNPGPVLDSLAEAALPRLPAFEPQGLSMMLWAFSKLEHPPLPEFVAEAVKHFDREFDRFGNQSVANIVYALGKMKQPLPARLCQRVEDLVVTAEAKHPLKDVELANVLYGFVRMSFQAPKLVSLLENRIARRCLVESSASMVWASLVWGAASLGLPLQPKTLDSLHQWGLEDWRSYTASSICNLAWGLSVLGEVHHPAFVKAVSVMVASHKRRTLEPRLMRQLFQAVSTAKTLGVDIHIPADTEQAAHKWWRKGNLSKSMSMSHEAVARAIKKLGLDSAAQHRAGYGLPIVDIAIETETEDIAIMIASPAEYAINTREPLGRIKSESRLLEAAGWKVVNLPADSLRKISSERSVLRAVGHLLEDLGISTEWQKAAEAAPKSVPPWIASNRRRWDGYSEEDLAEPRLFSRKDAEAVTTRVKGQSDASIAHSDPQEELSKGEIPQSGDLLAASGDLEAEEAKKLRARQRRQQVAAAMKGDFMEDWLSLADWKAQKKVIPQQKGDD